MLNSRPPAVAAERSIRVTNTTLQSSKIFIRIIFSCQAELTCHNIVGNLQLYSKIALVDIYFEARSLSTIKTTLLERRVCETFYTYSTMYRDALIISNLILL